MIRSRFRALICFAFLIGLTQKEGLVSAESAAESYTGKIPRILHYIYLSGFDAYMAETQKPRAKLITWYRETCMEVHKHWEVKFWTEEMAYDLVSTRFPEFLPIWNSYDMEVKRADAIRSFIMLEYGGMYLDLDNECYRPAEEVFGDFDVVLQGTGFEGLNNGMMASAAGHPIWKAVVQTMLERYKGNDGDMWHDNPIYMTGPAVLTNTTQRYLKMPYPVSGFLGRTYHVDNTKVRVYSLGEFFVPCWGTDYVCLRRYDTGYKAGTWNMTNIVGRHWFSGSWNKPWLKFNQPAQKQRRLRGSHDMGSIEA